MEKVVEKASYSTTMPTPLKTEVVMATSRKDPSTLGGSTTMRTKQHTNAVCVMGQMVEFSPGTSSEEMACNAMVEASIEESPIYFRGAAENEWVEIEGAKLHVSATRKV